MAINVNSISNLVHTQNKIGSTTNVFDNGDGTYTVASRGSKYNAPVNFKIITEGEYKDTFQKSQPA